MQICGRRYDTNQAVVVTVENGLLASIEPCTTTADAPHEELPWIAPGFVDLQVNGYGGQEFNDFNLDAPRVVRVCRALESFGVTSFLPTATTHSFEMLAHTMSVLADAVESSPDIAARVPGIHLEGPYVSAEDGPRGAHPRQHCRPPDWDEFQRLQEAARGKIRLLTLSPEYESAPEVIRRAVASGVLVAIGHTAASSDQIQAAVDAGARMSTHLGNGAHGQLRRHPNYLWDQLADDRLTASIIADGHHLPPAVVKCFVRAKTPGRCILVSDLTGMAGMPPGLYENTSVGSVEVLKDGRLVVAGQRQYLAGAALPLTVCIANVMRFADVSLAEAIDMAAARPAALIGLAAGTLQIGAPADLVQFELPSDNDRPLTVRATMIGGQTVYGQFHMPAAGA